MFIDLWGGNCQSDETNILLCIINTVVLQVYQSNHFNQLSSQLSLGNSSLITPYKYCGDIRIVGLRFGSETNNH
jgi:hypothetical protein